MEINEVFKLWKINILLFLISVKYFYQGSFLQWKIFLLENKIIFLLFLSNSEPGEPRRAKLAVEKLENFNLIFSTKLLSSRSAQCQNFALESFFLLISEGRSLNVFYCAVKPCQNFLLLLHPSSFCKSSWFYKWNFKECFWL